jgi:hypothetical protein
VGLNFRKDRIVSYFLKKYDEEEISEYEVSAKAKEKVIILEFDNNYDKKIRSVNMQILDNNNENIFFILKRYTSYVTGKSKSDVSLISYKIEPNSFDKLLLEIEEVGFG